jgi:hypothetical protein
VAKIEVTTTEGTILSFPVAAGEHVSEWSATRVAVRHRLAAVFEGVTVGTTRGHWYLARIALKGRHQARSIKIIAGAGSLVVNRLSIRDAQTETTHPIATRIADRSRWRHLEDVGTVGVYENTRALPRAWLVGHVRTLAPAALLTTLRDGRLPAGERFDPGTMALVEQPVALVSAVPAASDLVVVDHLDDTTVRLRTRSAAPAFLVVSDVDYPGWLASVDGQPAALYRTDYVLRGLPVPAGEHVVEMVFRPRSLFVGIGVSAASALLLALAVPICRGTALRTPAPPC